MQGVWPLGAQVRRTLGMSRKPLSSTNTRWAPRRAAFFYPGPVVPLPPGDGGLVALNRAALGFLATPSQRGQHLPDVGGVVPHAELLHNQFGHAVCGPELGPVPSPKRALAQQRHESALLRLGQPRRPSRRGLALQRLRPLSLVRLPPATDRTHR